MSVWSQSGLPVPPSPVDRKQSAWDLPGVLLVKSQVEDSLKEVDQRARFLAATAPHSGDWLLALPIVQCGLRMDNEAVRVAVSLRLGLNLGAAHTCRCGTQVDATGLHAFVCKHAPGRIARHQALNEVVYRALSSAAVPASKEPSGLVQQDGRRPDGMTLIPWQTGKQLVWDVTVICTLAQSYVDRAAQGVGEAAKLAAQRKIDKYSDMSRSFTFIPLAFENLGALDLNASEFFTALGRRITDVTGDVRESAFLFQRLSVVLQRFNAVLLSDTFTPSFTEPDL